MRGGEIFVPKLNSTKITDIADIIAPEAKKKIIGIKPGEKLDEVLITEEESFYTKEFEKFFIIEPQYSFWDKDHSKNGKPLPIGFKYTSKSNIYRIAKDEMAKLLKNIKIEK